MRNSDKDAALQAVYDQVPPMASCEGHCWNSCGPVPMSDRERQRIREAGYRISPPEVAMASGGTYWCEALTGEGRCAVYELRPASCRTWGTARSLRCPWGCVPEGGWLSDAEVRSLLAESMEAGGGGYSPGAAAALRAQAAAFASAGDARAPTELPPEITSRKPRRRKASRERR